MKAILTLMTIAIVMASIGMVAAAIPDEDGTLLISMTTQEYVDYYGMLYLEGDRSQGTTGTLEIFAERYGMYPTMDIYATATVTEVTVVPEPVQTPVVAPEPTPTQTIEEPKVVPTVPEDDAESNTMLIFIVFVVACVGVILLTATRQKKE